MKYQNEREKLIKLLTYISIYYTCINEFPSKVRNIRDLFFSRTGCPIIPVLRENRETVEDFSTVQLSALYTLSRTVVRELSDILYVWVCIERKKYINMYV